MTIKIEREALQCITNDSPSCSVPLSGESQVDCVPDPRFKVSDDYPDLELTDIDDSSSVSSYSFSSASADRKVTWSNPLVTEVRTRERTKQEDVRSLFYSYEETQRFRQEYRLERRRGTEDESPDDNESCSDEGYCARQSTATGWSRMNFKDNCVVPPSNLSLGKHRISRVVVMHKNVLETFIDEELTASYDVNYVSNFNTTGATGTDSELTVVTDAKTASDDFFDNDSFWSGQITWY